MSDLTIKNEKKKYFKQKYYDFKDGKRLITFLNQIPELQKIKFKLSEQQCDVVGENKNLIVMGRSGTGKTTCALMRLFSIQVLFKNTYARSGTEVNQGFFQSRSEFLDTIFGIKNIFLTASPCLIIQIQKLYSELIDHVKRQLQKKFKNQSSNSNNCANIDFQKFKENLQQNRINENNLQDINQFQEAQRQRQRFTSFKNLSESQYPGFFTTKQFLIMIDAELTSPFFVRGENYKLVKQYRGGMHQSYKVSKNGCSQFAIQCDWQIFEEEFWPKVDWRQKVKLVKRNKSKTKIITALAVWTEICSTIKGDCTCYLEKDRCLTKQKYLQKSKNKYYDQYQKSAIYDIFLDYEGWKIKEPNKYFDQLDFVNYLLYNLQKQQTVGYFNQQYNSNGCFNYLFLDQIQDLPPATSYLISKLFTDGLYYAGDTAQAIQKGVAFKFQDLKHMFHESFQAPLLGYQMPAMHHLTVNFRSHKKILQLANSITSMLLKLFPNSIDWMKKEQSKLDGPHSIYLVSNQVNIIKQLLFEEGDRILGQSQVILVRSKEQKQLPQEIRAISNGLVLTLQQCKGLEFNDIIVCNFFNSTTEKQWKVLKYLDFFPQRGATKFNIGQIQISQFQKLESQLKQLYTLVTRTKCTLIFYEQFNKIPPQLLQLWQYMGLLYTSKDFKIYKNEMLSYKQQIKKEFPAFWWSQQGFKFFQRRQYQLALVCYQRIDRYEICEKIRGIMTEEKADILFRRAEHHHNVTPNFYEVEEDQDIEEKKGYQLFLKACSEAYKYYRQAGSHYENINQNKKAAICYYKGRDYENAAKNYQKLTNYVSREMGCCYQKLKKYDLAAKYLYQSQQYVRFIKNLQKCKSSQQILSQLDNIEQFEEKQFYKIKFLRKISQLQFQSHIKEKTTAQEVRLQVSFEDQILAAKIIHFNYLYSINLRNRQNLFGIISSKIDHLFHKFQRNGYFRTEIKIDKELIEMIAQHKLLKSKKQQCEKQLNFLIQIKSDQIYNSNIQNEKKEKLKKLQQDYQIIGRNVSKSKQTLKSNITQITNTVLQEMKQNLLWTMNKQLQNLGSILSNFQYLVLASKNLANYKLVEDISFDLQLRYIQQIRMLISSNQRLKVQNAIQHFSISNNQTFQYHLQAIFNLICSQKLENQRELIKKKQFHLQSVKIFKESKFLAIKKQILAFISQVQKQLETFQQNFYPKIAKNIKSLQCPNLVFNNTTVEIQSSQKIMYYLGNLQSRRLQECIRLLFTNRFADVSKIFHFQSQILSGKARQINSKLNLVTRSSPHLILQNSLRSGCNQLSMQMILAIISRYSGMYRNKQDFQQQIKQRRKNQDQEIIRILKSLGILNNLQFPMKRTSLRKQKACFQLFEGLLLLGFQQWEHLAHQIDNQFIKYQLMSSHQKFSTREKIDCFILVNQWYTMQKAQLQPWLFKQKSRIPKQIQTLSEQEERTIQRDIFNQNEQLKRQRTSAFQQLSKKLAKATQIIDMRRRDKQKQYLQEIKLADPKKYQKQKDLQQNLSKKVQQQYTLQNYDKYINNIQDMIYYQIDEGKDKIRKENENIQKLSQEYYETVQNIKYYDQKMLDQFQQCLRDYQHQRESIQDQLTLLEQNQKNKQNYYKEHIKLNAQSKQIQKDEELVSSIQQQYIDYFAYFQNTAQIICDSDFQNKITTIRQDLQSLEQYYYLKFNNPIDQILLLRTEATKFLFQIRQRQSAINQIQGYLKQLKNQNYLVDKTIRLIKQLSHQIQNNKTKRVLRRKDKIKVKIAQYCASIRRQKISEMKDYYTSTSTLIDHLYQTENQAKLNKYLTPIFYKYKNQQKCLESYQYLQLLIVALSLSFNKRLMESFKIEQLKSQNLLNQALSSIKEAIQKPFDNQSNFKIFRQFLSLFKCKYVTKQSYLSIFNNFVLINKQSPLLESQYKPKYLYPLSYSKQIYITTLQDCLKLVRMKVDILESYGLSDEFSTMFSLHQQRYADNLKKQKKTEKIGLVNTNITLARAIMRNKINLLDFYYKKSFIGHESFLFVYNQLKLYYDLQTILQDEDLNQLTVKNLKEDVAILENQFRNWKDYAEKNQFSRKYNCY